MTYVWLRWADLYIDLCFCFLFFFSCACVLQLEASTNQGLDQHMPLFNLPSKILCRVVHVQLRVSSCWSLYNMLFIMLDVVCGSVSFISHYLCYSSPFFLGWTRHWWSLRTDYSATWTKCESFTSFCLFCPVKSYYTKWYG